MRMPLTSRFFPVAPKVHTAAISDLSGLAQYVEQVQGNELSEADLIPMIDGILALVSVDTQSEDLRAISKLTSLLQAETPKVRKKACTALGIIYMNCIAGEIGNQVATVVDALTNRLADENIDVKAKACQALGHIVPALSQESHGDNIVRAIDGLVALLEGEKDFEDIFEAVCRALGNMDLQVCLRAQVAERVIDLLQQSRARLISKQITNKAQCNTLLLIDKVVFLLLEHYPKDKKSGRVIKKVIRSLDEALLDTDVSVHVQYSTCYSLQVLIYKFMLRAEQRNVVSAILNALLDIIKSENLETKRACTLIGEMLTWITTDVFDEFCIRVIEALIGQVKKQLSDDLREPKDMCIADAYADIFSNCPKDTAKCDALIGVIINHLSDRHPFVRTLSAQALGDLFQTFVDNLTDDRCELFSQAIDPLAYLYADSDTEVSEVARSVGNEMVEMLTGVVSSDEENMCPSASPYVFGR